MIHIFFTKCFYIFFFKYIFILIRIFKRKRKKFANRSDYFFILPIRMVATRIIPSESGLTSLTRPIDHERCGMLSSLIRTNVPFFNDGPLLVNHFFRVCNWDKYSRLHLCHIFWVRRVKHCQSLSRLSGTSDKSGSGKMRRDSPIRKWPDVKGIESIGWEGMEVRGLEFRTASIFIKMVFRSSNMR